MDYLPSRKYGLFLVVTIFVVAGVLRLSSLNGRENTVIATNNKRLLSRTTEGGLLSLSENATNTPKFAPAEPIPDTFQTKLSERVLNEEDARVGITLKDLKIIDNESRERIRRYGLDLRDALVSFNTSEEEPLSAFVAAFEKEDFENLPTLVATASKHDTAALDLAAVELPGSAAPMHLRLIRSIAHRSQLLRAMASIETAPLDALAAADQYILESDDLVANLAEVNQYFASHGIVFEKDEQGRFSYTKYE